MHLNLWQHPEIFHAILSLFWWIVLLTQRHPWSCYMGQSGSFWLVSSLSPLWSHTSSHFIWILIASQWSSLTMMFKILVILIEIWASFQRLFGCFCFVCKSCMWTHSWWWIVSFSWRHNVILSNSWFSLPHSASSETHHAISAESVTWVYCCLKVLFTHADIVLCCLPSNTVLICSLSSHISIAALSDLIDRLLWLDLFSSLSAQITQLSLYWTETRSAQLKLEKRSFSELLSFHLCSLSILTAHQSCHSTFLNDRLSWSYKIQVALIIRLVSDLKLWRSWSTSDFDDLYILWKVWLFSSEMLVKSLDWIQYSAFSCCISCSSTQMVCATTIPRERRLGCEIHMSSV